MNWEEIKPGMFAEDLDEDERIDAYTLSEEDRKEISSQIGRTDD